MKVILQLILLCVVLPYSSINAQKKAVVLDAQSGEPIPFVNIQIKGEHIGTTTNVNGEYQLKAQANKQIIFSAVGYNTFKTHIDSLTEVIMLHPSNIVLAEISVSTRKTKETKIGKLKRQFPSYHFGNSSNTSLIRAQFYPYEESYLETPFLKKISFLTSSDVKDAKFNIRLYNAIDNNPGELIYDKNLIGIARKGDRKTIINLDTLNLTFPQNGLFIAIEWLHIDHNRHEYKYSMQGSKKKHKATSIEPSFSCVKDVDNNINTWHYFGKWRKQESSFLKPIMCEITLSN